MSAQLSRIPFDYRETDVDRFDFALTPDWRYRRALQIIDEQPRSFRSDRIADAAIRVVHAFLRCRQTLDAAARSQLRVTFPGLYEAFEIFESADCTPRLYVECRILAQQSDREIAEKLQLKAEAIKWYELAFYNVRDRLNTRDWIVVKSLNPAKKGNLSEYESVFKRFAYFAGPLVFERLLKASQDPNRPRNLDELEERLDELTLSQVEFAVLVEIERDECDMKTTLRLVDVYRQKKYGKAGRKMSPEEINRFTEGARASQEER